MHLSVKGVKGTTAKDLRGSQQECKCPRKYEGGHRKSEKDHSKELKGARQGFKGVTATR